MRLFFFGLIRLMATFLAVCFCSANALRLSFARVTSVTHYDLLLACVPLATTCRELFDAAEAEVEALDVVGRQEGQTEHLVLPRVQKMEAIQQCRLSYFVWPVPSKSPICESGKVHSGFS